jgi:hypothetical protein
MACKKLVYTGTRFVVKLLNIYATMPSGNGFHTNTFMNAAHSTPLTNQPFSMSSRWMPLMRDP